MKTAVVVVWALFISPGWRSSVTISDIATEAECHALFKKYDAFDRRKATKDPTSWSYQHPDEYVCLPYKKTISLR